MLRWPDVLNLAKNGNPPPDRKVVQTDAEWRQQLSPEEYHVTRRAGTERPFSSEMCSLLDPGIYSCLCCNTVLFDASEKFESGTGWPSFTQPVAANVIAYRFDGPSFLKRVETVCNTCDAHLGHVFPDDHPRSGHPEKFREYCPRVHAERFSHWFEGTNFARRLGKPEATVSCLPLGRFQESLPP